MSGKNDLTNPCIVWFQCIILTAASFEYFVLKGQTETPALNIFYQRNEGIWFVLMILGLKYLAYKLMNERGKVTISVIPSNSFLRKLEPQQGCPHTDV